MGRAATDDTGEILRRLHWQCWRADAPPLEIDLADLVAVLPMLIESGSVGLVWPRLRAGAERYGAIAAALEGAYQSQVAHNALVEGEIGRIVSRLHDAGIRPVLIKGRAVSRLYPAPIIRPAGDIDLVVSDADYLAAQEALSDVRLSFHGDAGGSRRTGEKRATSPIDVDLHGFSNWGEAVGADFFTDAQTIRLGGTEVLVPCVEDHLRALCLHFLRHAAVRPLRLCDIALLMGMEAGRLAWERVLRGSRRSIEQVEITLRLVEELLGTRLDDAPAGVRRRSSPAWLVPAMMRQWERNPSVPGPVLDEILANSRGIVRAFSRRWPDPITATLRVGSPISGAPRLPVELAAYLKQLVYHTIVTLPRQVARRVKNR